jgi:outer membrane protein
MKVMASCPRGAANDRDREEKVNVKSRRMLVLGMMLSLVMAFPAAAEKKVKDSTKEVTVTKDAAPAPAAAPAAKAASLESVPSTGNGYKIGVVNRKAVVKGYTKVANEYKKLEAEVNTRQVEITKLSDKIEGMKNDYEAKKKDMTPAERVEKESAVQVEFAKYKGELSKQQSEIDAKEGELMKAVLKEIDDAVKVVADKGAFHLILDGSTQAGPVFYSPTLDVSQQVIDILNANLK